MPIYAGPLYEGTLAVTGGGHGPPVPPRGDAPAFRTWFIFGKRGNSPPIPLTCFSNI